MNLTDRNPVLTYIENKMDSAISLMRKGMKLAEEPKAITICLNFFPLVVKTDDDGEPYMFVPVGTKDAPAGISNTKAPFTMVIENDNVLIFRTDVVKSYMKEFYKKLEKGITEDYKVMGIKVGLPQLMQFEQKRTAME